MIGRLVVMFACVWLPACMDEPVRRLFAVSPLVEQDGDVVFLDVRGTERLHGGTAGVFAAIARALQPQHARGLALAAQRFTAEIAARHAAGAVVVAPGDEALFLSRLPLAVLPMSPALARRLRPLGLESLGDLASLPVAAVERRYGAEGVALHRLARGDDATALLPARPAEQRAVFLELEAPVERLEALLPRLTEAVGRLCHALAERGLGPVSLRLRLELEGGGRAERVLTAAAPEPRAPVWSQLVRLRLESRPPTRPVQAFSVVVEAAQALLVHQNALFGEVARDAARRAEALSRLVSVWGQDAVRPPAVRSDHRLEARGAFAVSRPVLRLLDPPEELVPLFAGERLVGFRRGRRELLVTSVSAPRRLEGGWWSEPWARDEYDVLTRDGGAYRICRDMLGRRWRMLGELD